MGISLAIAAVMALVIALTIGATREADRKVLLVERILGIESERIAARDDFILRRGERAREQWVIKTDELELILDEVAGQFTLPAELPLVAQLRKDFESTNSSFEAILRDVEARGGGGFEAMSYSEVDSILIGQLFLKAYSMSSDLDRLHEMSHASLAESRRVEDAAIVFVILLGTAALLANSAGLNRVIMRKARVFSEGLAALGSGDLAHRIPVAGDDEFAELARAGNEMAARLEASHTSIEELRREMALRLAAEDEQRKFGAIIDTSLNEIMVFAQDSLRFEYANRSALDKLGRTMEELRLMTPVDIEPEFDEKVYRALLAPLESGDSPQLLFSTRQRRKEGSDYPVDVRLQLYRQADRAFFFAIIDDISERRRGEDGLRRALKEKETLLRELFHRTRNNMQVIIGILDTEAELSGDPLVEEVIRKADARILTMALVHTKLYESEDLSHIDLGEYCEDLVGLLAEDEACRAGRVRISLESESIPVFIDTAMPFGLAFHELVSNAIRHAYPDGRKGEVRIGITREPGGRIECTIADDGVGLPPGLDLRLGRGLGLQLVHALIEDQLGGRLWHESDRGLRWHASFEERGS